MRNEPPDCGGSFCTFAGAANRDAADKLTAELGTRLGNSFAQKYRV